MASRRSALVPWDRKASGEPQAAERAGAAQGAGPEEAPAGVRMEELTAVAEAVAVERPGVAKEEAPAGVRGVEE